MIECPLRVAGEQRRLKRAATLRPGPGRPLVVPGAFYFLVFLQVAWRAVHPVATYQVAGELLGIAEHYAAAEALPKLRLVPIAIAPAHPDAHVLDAAAYRATERRGRFRAHAVCLYIYAENERPLLTSNAAIQDACYQTALAIQAIVHEDHSII